VLRRIDGHLPCRFTPCQWGDLTSHAILSDGATGEGCGLPLCSGIVAVIGFGIESCRFGRRVILDKLMACRSGNVAKPEGTFPVKRNGAEQRIEQDPVDLLRREGLEEHGNFARRGKGTVNGLSDGLPAGFESTQDLVPIGAGLRLIRVAIVVEHIV
jgi:hypothetical protein